MNDVSDPWESISTQSFCSEVFKMSMYSHLMVYEWPLGPFGEDLGVLFSDTHSMMLQDPNSWEPSPP